MKKSSLLLLLTICFCSVAVSAQTRVRVRAKAGVLPDNIIRDLTRRSSDARQCLQDSFGGDLTALSASLRGDAQTLDLNGDKRTDYLIQLGNSCGGPPNTDSFVYASAGALHKLLWRGVARYFTPLKTTTGGRRDLEVGEHSSAAEQEVTILKYKPGRYLASRCFTRTFSEDRNGNTREQITPHRCNTR